jgi:hypothetical protein
MWRAYENCYNLSGNTYLYSNNITNMTNCFHNVTSLNIYTHQNSITHQRLYNFTNRIFDRYLIWEETDNCKYNTKYNIYIYPVANVAAAREANGD